MTEPNVVYVVVIQKAETGSVHGTSFFEKADAVECAEQWLAKVEHRTARVSLCELNQSIQVWSRET